MCEETGLGLLTHEPQRTELHSKMFLTRQLKRATPVSAWGFLAKLRGISLLPVPSHKMNWSWETTAQPLLLKPSPLPHVPIAILEPQILPRLYRANIQYPTSKPRAAIQGWVCESAIGCAGCSANTSPRLYPGASRSTSPDWASPPARAHCPLGQNLDSNPHKSQCPRSDIFYWLVPSWSAPARTWCCQPETRPET